MLKRYQRKLKQILGAIISSVFFTSCNLSEVEESDVNFIAFESAFMLLQYSNIVSDNPGDGIDSELWLYVQIEEQIHSALRENYSNVNWSRNYGGEIQIICYVFNAYIERKSPWDQRFADFPINSEIAHEFEALLRQISFKRDGGEVCV